MSKSVVTKNIFNLQEWHQNMWNCKSFFQQIFIVYKTLTVVIKTKNLLRTTRFCLWFFIEMFYKMTTCPRRPLVSGPRSSRLIQVWRYIKTLLYCCVVTKRLIQVQKNNHLWIFATFCKLHCCSRIHKNFIITGIYYRTQFRHMFIWNLP